jgi:hypothetical protein
MNKTLSALIGLALIGLGVLAMAFTVGMPILGLAPWGVFQLWRFWPLTVTSAGVAFCLPPLMFRHRRGLGGLFIPGVPILVNGGMLLFSSVLDWWGAWSWMWPLEVLSLAAAFVLAGVHMRVIWLLIPATILGMNGLLFQFCALTGLWDVWAFMWTIEPLSVGVALLLIGARKRRQGLMSAGVILCAVGGVGMVGMASIVTANWVLAGCWWLFRAIGPAILVLVGGLLLLWGLGHRSLVGKAR